MSGVSAFLSTASRDNKRRIQDYYFAEAAGWLGEEKTNVVDLPSIYLVRSLFRITQLGINVEHYMAFETIDAIAKKIRVSRKKLKQLDILDEAEIKVTIHNQDVLQFLIDRPRATVCKGEVGLFNFDFCDALTPKYRAFMLMDGVAKYMGKKAAVMTTFSARSHNNSERLQLATTEYAKVLGLNCKFTHTSKYRDTAPMKTNLCLFERDN